MSLSRLEAWKRVGANKGAPGVDGMTRDAFPDFAKEHWSKVHQSLMDGIYQPYPVKRKAIPKPQGRERLLGIPTVIDRVIQQAIAQVLQPVFDPTFSKNSFGFRPNRSAHDAVRQLRQHIKDDRQVAVDVDLKQFFDTVNHDALMVRISRCEYLGFTFPRGRIVWSDKSLRRFKMKIRELTKRSWGIRMAKKDGVSCPLYTRLEGYFALSEYYRPVPGLGEWIRRRIRSCFLMQWRYPRTIVRKLVSLGVDLKRAVMLAGSSKGPYRLAKTYAIQLGLNNERLASLGLLSVKELWIRFHHSR